MSSAAALNMSPEHPRGQCASCDMSVGAKEIAFYCSLCESPEGFVLCCVCFLCNSWCSDTTHRLTSTWVDPNGCPVEVQTTPLERNALKQGSIVALLRSRGAMMSEEVRRDYESTLGRSVPPDTFKWLAARGAISSAGQELHERWLSMLAHNETSSDENASPLDSQTSQEISAYFWPDQVLEEFPPQGNITEPKQHKHRFSTTTDRLKTRAEKVLLFRKS